MEDPGEEEDKDEDEKEDEEEEEELEEDMTNLSECKESSDIVYSIRAERKIGPHFHLNRWIFHDPTTHAEWHQKSKSSLCLMSRIRCCQHHVPSREAQLSQRPQIKTFHINHHRAWGASVQIGSARRRI